MVKKEENSATYTNLKLFLGEKISPLEKFQMLFEQNIASTVIRNVYL